MADEPMPDEITAYMTGRNWGNHHVQWHVVRVWDLVEPATRQWAEAQGWTRYPVQEGEEGNGLEFLAMHRVMIAELVRQFPPHAGLFTGWPQPPADPLDPADPLPGGATTPFRPAMETAIQRLRDQLADFDGEDGFGSFVETTLRPHPANPGRRSADASSGIHNYIHNRFSDGNSAINMGDPTVNIFNRRFWRLHGWIDARWTAYRQASGRQDTDLRYLQALAEAERHMNPPAPELAIAGVAAAGHGHGHGHGHAHPLDIPTATKANILQALYAC